MGRISVARDRRHVIRREPHIAPTNKGGPREGRQNTCANSRIVSAAKEQSNTLAADISSAQKRVPRTVVRREQRLHGPFLLDRMGIMAHPR